ncbi:MAG: lysozyme [Alteraurantiacibacter sp.]
MAQLPAAQTDRSLRADRLDGSTRSPANSKSTKRSRETRSELAPALFWMRTEMVRELLQRDRKRRHKRKTALAVSAAVMAASPGAIDYPAPATENMALDATKVRIGANNISVSDAMKEALAEEEGVRLTVYRDVAGYPTVGVGHLVRPADGLKVGDTITYEQALKFLDEDIKHAEEGVRNLVGELPLYQHEFDALADLIYNVGAGNVSEGESPKLNAAISSRDYERIAAELHYYHAGGSKANGLVYRSERRQAIFTDAAYHDPRPMEIGVGSTFST